MPQPIKYWHTLLILVVGSLCFVWFDHQQITETDVIWNTLITNLTSLEDNLSSEIVTDASGSITTCQFDIFLSGDEIQEMLNEYPQALMLMLNEAGFKFFFNEIDEPFNLFNALNLFFLTLMSDLIIFFNEINNMLLINEIYFNILDNLKIDVYNILVLKVKSGKSGVFNGDLIWIWIQLICFGAFTIWARGVGPRFRPDQLSDITWKDILIILIGLLTFILIINIL